MAYTISIAGTKVRLGEVWFDYKGKEDLLWRFAIKQKAKNSQKEFVSYRVVNSTAIQYCLAANSGSDITLPSGDAIVAQYLASQPTQKDEIRVFIKTVSGDNSDDSSGNSFWIVAIDDSGKIMVKEKLFAPNELELVSRMGKLNTIASRLSFFIPKNDHATNSLVYNFFKNTPGSLMQTIDEADLLEHQLPTMQFTRVTKSHRPVQTKKVALLIMATLGVLSTGMGYSYITQKEANEYFLSVSSEDGRLANYDDLIASLTDNGKKWTPDLFRAETLSQFSEQLDKGIYSPLDISLTIRAINRTLPFYIAEWRLISISYVDNSFFATYERLRGGSGVFFTLDQMMTKINGRNDLVITPYELRSEGNIREYRITNTALLATDSQVESITKSLTEDYALTKDIINIANSAASDVNAIYQLKSEYDELSFLSKWLKRATLPLYEQALVSENSISQLNNDLAATKLKKENIVQPDLNENITLGKVLDFVTMMQLDSFFNWSYPTLEAGFPSTETLQKRSIQPNGTQKKDTAYGPSIESYRVTVKSQDSEEEGKTTSYGISDLLRLGNLINKPFVKVDRVTYNTVDEQWVVSLHFFRQTEYYNKYVKDSVNTQGTVQ